MAAPTFHVSARTHPQLAPITREYCAVVAAIGWSRLASEQGKCLGDIGVVSGGQVLCGERNVVVGGDTDAVDELVVGAQLALGRKPEHAAVVEQVSGRGGG